MNHSSCYLATLPDSKTYHLSHVLWKLPDSNFVLFCFGWEFHTWIFYVLVISIPIFFPSILTPLHHLPSQPRAPTNWIHLMFLYVHGGRSICWNTSMLLGPNSWKKPDPPLPLPQKLSAANCLSARVEPPEPPPCSFHSRIMINS